MKVTGQSDKGRTGRPLSFDREAALHQAMLLFWRHGYEGTSLSALTSAMGVTPPSVYAAFGDKKQLFLEVARRYLGETADREAAVTAREAARDLMVAAAVKFTGPATPSGCLIAGSAITGSPASADIQEALRSIRLQTGRLLGDRIRASIAAGELPADTDADALSGYVMAAIQGMATLARDGKSREQLMQIIELAMLAWPKGDASI